MKMENPDIKFLRNKMKSEDINQLGILVTGASSQIGCCLLQTLVAEEQRVFVAGRSPLHDMTRSPLGFVEWDLSRNSCPENTFEAGEMIHIAGIWLLPRHLEALHGQGLRRVVCFSTTSVGVKLDSSNTGEREQTQRTLAAEREIAERCDALGVAWTILRPTLVYGLGMDRNITRAARFIRRFKCYPLAPGSTGLRQPVHADDLAMAALKALRTPKAVGRRYDVGGGETLAYNEMIGRIFDVLGMTRRFVPLPFLEQFVAASGVLLRRPEVTGEMVRRMRRDLICDNRAAEEDLDYAPRAFLSGGLDDLGEIGSGGR
jgi:nucleoside-diphosphate-sugar epimerase